MFCVNNEVNVDFEDRSTVNNGTITFWQYDLGGLSTSSLPSPSRIFTTSGDVDITLIVGSDQGCLDTNVITINIPEKPRAGFFFNTSNGLNVGAVFNFVDTSFNGFTYAWDFGDGGTADIQDPNHTYFENGTFEVTQLVTDLLGCVDSVKGLIDINTVRWEK